MACGSTFRAVLVVKRSPCPTSALPSPQGFLLADGEGLILLGFVAASSDPPSAGRGLCAGADEDGNPGQRVLERTVFFVRRHFGELQRASVLAERFQQRAGSALMELGMRRSSTRSPL